MCMTSSKPPNNSRGQSPIAPELRQRELRPREVHGLGWIPALSVLRTPGVIPPFGGLWLWSPHCAGHLGAPCSASSVAPTDSRKKSSFTLVFKAPSSPDPMPLLTVNLCSCAPVIPSPSLCLAFLPPWTALSSLALHPIPFLQRRRGEKDTEGNGPLPHRALPGASGSTVFSSLLLHTQLGLWLLRDWPIEGQGPVMWCATLLPHPWRQAPG